LRDDLSRRDFTVNALAWSPDEGVADHFDGLRDLEQGVIRCVGGPEERFSEDALRILRCERFASTLDFTIEENTARAMHEMKEKLTPVARERVRVELVKAILGRGFERVFTQHADILFECIPELRLAVVFPEGSLHSYAHIIKSVACALEDITVRMALLLGKIEEREDCTAAEILRRLRFATRDIDYITELIKYQHAKILPERAEVKRWLGRIGPVQLVRLIEAKRADLTAMGEDPADMQRGTDEILSLCDEIIRNKECYNISMLAVSGDDLIVAGMKSGKEIGEMLRMLTEMVIDEILPNDRDALLAYLQNSKFTTRQ